MRERKYYLSSRISTASITPHEVATAWWRSHKILFRPGSVSIPILNLDATSLKSTGAEVNISWTSFKIWNPSYARLNSGDISQSPLYPSMISWPAQTINSISWSSKFQRSITTSVIVSRISRFKSALSRLMKKCPSITDSTIDEYGVWVIFAPGMEISIWSVDIPLCPGVWTCKENPIGSADKSPCVVWLLGVIFIIWKNILYFEWDFPVRSKWEKHSISKISFVSSGSLYRVHFDYSDSIIVALA